MIPAEAIEAAGEFLPPVWTSNEVYRARLIQALDAAARHILSHEREQTRLAHLDAMVNRETKLNELADAWDEGMEALYATTSGEWPPIPESNPYRSETMSQVIPAEAVEVAAKWLHDVDCRSAFHSGHPADIVCYDWVNEAKELVATIAPHMQASAIEELSEARNEDDTKFIFTWGQRDWLATESNRIRGQA